MFKSIRWRLQVWHAAILLLAVAGFGAVLYGQTKQARLDEIDAELHAAASTLEGTLRGLPLPGDPERRPPPPPPDAGDRRPPPGPFRGPRQGPPGRGGRPPAPPPRDRERERQDRERIDRERIDRALVLPEPFLRRFDDEAPYFVVWLGDDSVLRSSLAAADVPRPGPASALGGKQQARQRGDLREVVVPGRDGTRVLVGRPIAREVAELERLRWRLMWAGLGMLSVGLAGGWLLSLRAVRPIAAMSATAAAISADNLSRRIDLAGVDSELGGLAGTLNAMFARLEAAFERQARFTADASHELRTPLAVVLSQAELALARPRAADEYREALEASLRAAQRMRGLVEGLLTLARADAGRLELCRQPVDLGRLVEDGAALVGPLAEKADVEVHVTTEGAEVVGDPGRLTQVVTNLLTNAINYNRPGGVVAVHVEEGEGEAVLTVADSGCGIPEEDRGHVFERFYRADRARGRGLGGTGLGLAICKSIVDAHGGTITFTSEAGRGTTFVVRLPLAARGVVTRSGALALQR
jgi:heavy metal sensor kinase